MKKIIKLKAGDIVPDGAEFLYQEWTREVEDGTPVSLFYFLIPVEEEKEEKEPRFEDYLKEIYTAEGYRKVSFHMWLESLSANEWLEHADEYVQARDRILAVLKNNK